MKATLDHFLMVVGLLIVGVLASQTVGMRPDPVTVVERDCALFYGSISKHAEQECRAQMLEQHLLIGGVSVTKGAAE